jgi:hypothetical protein
METTPHLARRSVSSPLNKPNRLTIHRRRSLVLFGLLSAVALSVAHPSSTSSSMSQSTLPERPVKCKYESIEGAPKIQIASSFYSVEGPKTLFLVISINPRDISRTSMTALTRRIKSQFCLEKKITVAILDNHEAARAWAPTIEKEWFQQYLRGTYFLDLISNEEWIEFSTMRNRPMDEVRIDFASNKKSNTDGSKNSPQKIAADSDGQLNASAGDSASRPLVKKTSGSFGRKDMPRNSKPVASDPSVTEKPGDGAAQTGLLEELHPGLVESEPPDGIKLLPGYKHKSATDFEANDAGEISKPGGVTIKYEMGFSQGMAVDLTPKDAYVWYRERKVSSITMVYGLTKDNVLIVSIPLDNDPEKHRAANFYGKIRKPEDIADMLTMVLPFADNWWHE